VQAHTSATADDNTAGWQELAPQLNSSPMQIDLFAAASNTWRTDELGSNSALLREPISRSVCCWCPTMAAESDAFDERVRLAGI